MEAPDYQVGAHFEALDEGIVVAALNSTRYFMPFQYFQQFGEGDRYINAQPYRRDSSSSNMLLQLLHMNFPL